MSALLSRPDKIAGVAIVIAAAFAAVPRPTLSLATDHAQNIEIVANSSELDNIKNVTTFTGNVIVTQGSIRITGDRLTVYHNADDDIELLVMEGAPATYRQLPDNRSTHDEAQALRMEYHKLKNLVILIDKALVNQASGSLSGDRIEYDSAQSLVRATSTPPDSQAEPEPGGRVKIIIPSGRDPSSE